MKYQQYWKRDAAKNYFPLPNEIFCLGLCSGEIAVYAYLLYCEDRKTYQCYPSFRTIDELMKSAEALSPASEEIQNLYIRLISQLTNYKGKKMYGYLPKNIKQTVNCIVAELAKDERIAELYSEWNKANREKLSVYYDKKKPDIPLEENKEFRDIKNAVIRSAVLMMKAEQQGQSMPTPRSRKRMLC